MHSLKIYLPFDMSGLMWYIVQGSAQALISEGQFFSYTHIETKEKCMVIVDDITYIKNRVNGIVVFVFYWPIGKQLRLQGKS